MKRPDVKLPGRDRLDGWRVPRRVLEPVGCGCLTTLAVWAALALALWG